MKCTYQVRNTQQEGGRFERWVKIGCEVVVVLWQFKKETEVTEGRTDESVGERRRRRGLE